MAEPILVTGGAGFIGSHVCKALAQSGFLPVTLDSLARGFKENVRFGPLEVGDVRDRIFVEEVIKRYQPTAVLHFAAVINVGESVENPELYYNNNTLGTLTLATAAKDCGIRDFVFSSTAAVYGSPDSSPLNEDFALAPINPYGKSKLTSENILFDFARAYKMRPIVLRYFNASGADPETELGESHEPETHLIPLILQSQLYPKQKDRSLKVFGTDYPTPDGTCVRDYIHVTDLAQAHVLALKGLRAGVSPQPFNLGNSRGFSVLEVISTAEQITGQSIPYQVTDRRPGDPPALVADSTRARKLLSWTPQHSDLKTIIETTWKWENKKRGAKK